MNFLLNYADGPFEDSQRKNRRTGFRVGGFDRVLCYGPRDIEPDFRREHQAILDQPRGAGYWLWKPYFVFRTLKTLGPDDTLFYCDSGAHFICSVRPLFDLLKDGRDVMVFCLEHQERRYTKRDCFRRLDCDLPEFADTPQRLATMHLWRSTPRTLALAEEWLALSTDPGLLTDLESESPNYPDFVDHRHDQSILSLLTKRYGIEAFRDPSQWGNAMKAQFPNSPYPQLVDHTRKRNAYGRLSQIWRFFDRLRD